MGTWLRVHRKTPLASKPANVPVVHLGTWDRSDVPTCTCKCTRTGSSTGFMGTVCLALLSAKRVQAGTPRVVDACGTLCGYISRVRNYFFAGYSQRSMRYSHCSSLHFYWFCHMQPQHAGRMGIIAQAGTPTRHTSNTHRHTSGTHTQAVAAAGATQLAATPAASRKQLTTGSKQYQQQPQQATSQTEPAVMAAATTMATPGRPTPDPPEGAMVRSTKVATKFSRPCSIDEVAFGACADLNYSATHIYLSRHMHSADP